MIVVVDIDNVLNNLTEKTIELYNTLSSKNIQMSDIITYNFADCLPQEDADGITELFKKRELWSSLTPLADSQWGAKNIDEYGARSIFGNGYSPRELRMESRMD